MSDAFFLEERDSRGVVRLTLNRPDVHNAFNARLIADLTAALVRLDADPAVRVVVLAGAGKSFSAGADLNWMRSMAGYSEAENQKDAEDLARLMDRLNHISKPTVALVQGAAFGGGVGLVACCDIVLASDKASFCLSEVKLGLIPAAISPYVIAAMGLSAARRYFLTAERFSAQEAHRLGMVHEVVAPDELEAAGASMIETLLVGGPRSQAESKDLIFAVSQRPLSEEVLLDTARRIARVRVSEEGQEGLSAFFEKRSADWVG
ncbi:enoyl-CoA hydratase/isomerase family protein [Rhodovibrionaceae bacterium A322]